MLVELKGPGRVVASAQTERDFFELLRYSDMSWGIRRAGTTLSAWEPHEGVECVHYFIQLLGLHSEPVIVIPKAGRRSHANLSGAAGAESMN